MSRLRLFSAEPLDDAAAAIPMVLHCPACGLQHIDAPSEGWDNRPHRSHLCRPTEGGCGHVWRPADVATVGVLQIASRGACDHPPALLDVLRERRSMNLLLKLAADKRILAETRPDLGALEDAKLAERCAVMLRRNLGELRQALRVVEGEGESAA